MNTISFTYPKLRILAKKIAGELQNWHSGADFITFSNGGLDACSLVARQLPWKPNVLAIDINSCVWPRLVSSFQLEHTPPPLVIIDDCLDTGLTLEKFNSNVTTKIPCYFLLEKQNSQRVYTPQQVFAAEIFQTEDWFEFEWEIASKTTS